MTPIREMGKQNDITALSNEMIRLKTTSYKYKEQNDDLIEEDHLDIISIGEKFQGMRSLSDSDKNSRFDNVSSDLDPLDDEIQEIEGHEQDLLNQD